MTKEYKTITEISGPLIFVEKTEPVGYMELVEIRTGGDLKRGQVLDSSDEIVVIQVFEGTGGLSKDSAVSFTGDVIKMPLSPGIVGRVLSGSGKPRDGGPEIVPEVLRDIAGAAINPASREKPRAFIQTGISTIDGTNTLVRGQKLPIFSGAGLPHNDLALQIARQAKALGEAESFAVIFCAMGITNEEAQHFLADFERTGALERAVVFLNLADDPAVERILTPRLGLTTAEYLAFDLDMHVLIIYTDMTNYCESLREISTIREEIPSRKGYPGYLYSDLSMIYERAGMIGGIEGSITQMPILTMPNDDISHPVPDLSGYITEGQIVLERDLDHRNIYPPIAGLPSLSRLMKDGIGPGMTREDHAHVASQLFAAYSHVKDVRALAAVIGEEELTPLDKIYMDFGEKFEREFLCQGEYEDRSITETLDIGWKVISYLPKEELYRISEEELNKYYGK